jgi:hypothetical protein
MTVTGTSSPAAANTLPVIEKQVVVIGGGPAGIACLRRTSQQLGSEQVVLLEANGILGGRVRQALGDSSGVRVREGGAEFAYADLTEALSALGYAVKVDDLESVDPYNAARICIFKDRQFLCHAEVFGGLNKDELVQDIFREMKDFGRDISMKTFLDKHSPTFRTLQQTNPVVASLIQNALIAEYACDSLEEMGIYTGSLQVKEIGEAEQCNTFGTMFRVRSGYGNLIAKVAEGFDARTNTTVAGIHFEPDGRLFVTARDSIANRAIWFRAMEVVLAVPVTALKAIKLPDGIDAVQAIQRGTKGTFGEGHVVKVLFSSSESLLPEGMEVLTVFGSPVEVWQRRIAAHDYQCTLWLPGPAAQTFMREAEFDQPKVSAGSRPNPAVEHIELRELMSQTEGKPDTRRAELVSFLAKLKDEDRIETSERPEPPAKAIAMSMLRSIFGDRTNAINRMAVLPWSRLPRFGHAYRTLKPTGKTFDQLDQPHSIRLGEGLTLTGADINWATVPAALDSGRRTADEITARLKR